MSLMFAPWRLPKLDRIGRALATFDGCKCRRHRLAVERLLDDYDRGLR